MKVYSYNRFSTPEQIKGDSLRRQIELSEQYAKQHGLLLDDSLKLQDLGLSAYSGEHRNKGALGTFLRLIESGEIAEGSILIVESLDRLSREEVFVALEQFMGIIRNGIKIVTLSDNREYDKNNLNAIDLVVSIMSMCRAHEESAMKAMRLGKAWENKRNLASIKKLTKRCPAWLLLDDEKNSFKIIPGSNEVIRRIFKMKLAGKGVTAITHDLNAKPEMWKPKSNDKRKTAEGWRESYIKKILKNPAVIGKFQPHKLVKGKRQPIGDAIPDYYPPIVDTDIFYRVQEQLRNNIYKGGQTGKVSNLFSHIVKCEYCGGPLAYVDKGPAPKGGKYLVCDRARRGLGCSNNHIKYGDFEHQVLCYCKELRPQDILDKNDETNINLLTKEIEGIKGKFNSIKKEIENIANSISLNDDNRVREILVKKMTEKFNEQDILQKEENHLKQQINDESKSFDNVQMTLDSQKKLITILETEKTDKRLIDIRRKLRNEIRKLIDKIVIYPYCTGRATHQSINNSSHFLSGFYNDVTEVYENPNKIYQSGHKHKKESLIIEIIFKSGNMRTIYPPQEQFGTAFCLDFDRNKGTLKIQTLGQEERVMFEIVDDGLVNRKVMVQETY